MFPVQSDDGVRMLRSISLFFAYEVGRNCGIMVVIVSGKDYFASEVDGYMASSQQIVLDCNHLVTITGIRVDCSLIAFVGWFLVSRVSCEDESADELREDSRLKIAGAYFRIQFVQ